MPASFDTLQSLAVAKGMTLKRAYIAAGIPTSSYYRHLREHNGMTLGTYNKVLAVLTDRPSGAWSEGGAS